jgi:hypothetical protein
LGIKPHKVKVIGWNLSSFFLRSKLTKNPKEKTNTTYSNKQKATLLIYMRRKTIEKEIYTL